MLLGFGVCVKVWRRANKKSRGEAVAKRRTRKGAKIQKAIVGISLEEIKQRRAAKPDPSKVCRSFSTSSCQEVEC